MTNSVKTKSGMASFYLVAFSALVFGIITMSFVTISLNEARKATQADLSQSAYDSAMAGIEDAKSLLAMYNTCKSKNGQGDVYSYSCSEIINQVEGVGFDTDSCDVIPETLKRARRDGEVVVQEGDDASNANQQNSMDQAYTCVKINKGDDIADYRSYLSSNDRVRVIPVNSSQYDKVTGIRLQWHSNENLGRNTMFGTVGGSGDTVLKLGTFAEASSKIPVIKFELFQTDENFQAYELDANNDRNNGSNHVAVTLYPNPTNEPSDGDDGTVISAESMLYLSDKTIKGAPINDQGGRAEGNDPVVVSCGYEDGFKCRSVIEFPATYQDNTTRYSNRTKNRGSTTFFLKISLPYGVSSTDFSIALCTNAISENGKCVSDEEERQAQLAIAKEELREIEEVIAETQTLINETQNKINAEENSINEQKQKIETAIQDMISRIEKEIEELRAKADEKDKEAERYQGPRSRAEELRHEALELRNQAQALEDSIPEQTAELQNSLNALDARLQSLKDTLAQAQEDLVQLEEQRIIKLNEVEALERQIEESKGFSGVQAVVDSTGRAGDQYRRLVAYIDLVPTNGSYYPSNELNLYGKDNNLTKNFYITKDCQKMVNGNIATGCTNYGSL